MARRGLWICAAAAYAALLGLPGAASADRDFGPRVTANIQGDVTGTGNALLSCDPATDGKCAAARAGTAGGGDNNNNSRPMTYVDVDNDPSTFNSSSATLTLPAGARVVGAAVYYGGRDQAGSNGQAAPNPSARDRLLLKAPGSSAYVPVTASVVDDAGSSGNPNRLYAGFADVTGIVKAAGSGEYTVANVQLGTGLNADQSGGWSLAVFYEDPTLPQRNVTVFDGFKFVTARNEGGQPITLPLSGFLTPRSGPVRSRVGLIAFEGDLGLTGDSALLNGSKLTNTTNPQDNYFNSSLSTTGGSLTAKRPNYLNQLGFDGDILQANGYLGNNQTSTNIVLQTDGDGYAPAAVSIATDLYAPALTPTKTVDEAEARLGDELTYTISLQNTGLDTATDVTLVDPIPAGTTFVAGSLEVTAGAQPGAKTDATGDDQAEYDPATRSVTFRLGTGATAEDGGRLAVGDATELRFRARVNTTGLPGGARIVNSGTASFVSDTLGQSGSVKTPDAVTVVRVPDVTIDKSHEGRFEVGERTPFKLVVRNVGDAPTLGKVTVTDELPAELSFRGDPGGSGWDCDVAGRDLTCSRDDALAPGDAWPAIRFDALVDEDASPGEIVNTAVVRGGGETNELNNESTDTGPLPAPRIDLAIDKRAVGERFFPGERVEFVLRVTNLGPNRATGVRVRDVLPPGLRLVSLSSSQGTCAGSACDIGELRRGQVETISVVTVAGLNTGGRSLRDVAVVGGDQRDLNPGNNRDTATVRIQELVDLQVEKIAAAPTVPAGADVQFTVTIRNAGPSHARQVVFGDRLPAGLELVSLTPSQGTCSPPVCLLGGLRRDAVAQVVVIARSTPAQAGQTFVNTAGALALGQLERTPADNVSRAQVELVAGPVPQSDIVVSKVAETVTAVVGEPLQYLVTVTNQGPDPASAVTVTETPGSAVTVVAAAPSQGACAIGPTVRCDLGPLAVGATATIGLTVIPLEAGEITNAVTAITPGTDPGPESNVAGQTESVTRAPRLRLTKRASRHLVLGGEPVTFTISVRSLGPGTARDTQVCDRLPDGLAVVRRDGARIRGDRLCWTIGDLPQGATRRFHPVVRARRVSSPTRVTNIAVATADGVAAVRDRARVRILPLPPGACAPAASRATRPDAGFCRAATRRRAD